MENGADPKEDHMSDEEDRPKMLSLLGFEKILTTIVRMRSQTHTLNLQLDGMASRLFLESLLKIELTIRGRLDPNYEVTEKRLRSKRDIIDFLTLCIDSKETILAGQIVESLKYDELPDSICISFFDKLLKRQTLEDIELMIEILKKNPSAMRALPNCYPLLVKSQIEFEEDKTSVIKPAMICQGKFIYYVSEILAYTDPKEVDPGLSKELTTNIEKFFYSNEMKQCHSPFLTMVLLAEFLKKLSASDVLHQNLINNSIESVFQMSLILQSQVKNEKIFEFIHQMKDLRNRRVLDIIVMNGFYKLLQNNDLGVIAENLWAGTNARKLMNYGWVTKFCKEDFNEEVTDFSCPISESQKWIFQFNHWKQSCEYRYIAESVSICCLAVFYQLVILISIDRDSLHDLNAHWEVVILMRLSQFWIISSMIGEFLQIIYAVKMGMAFKMDYW